MLADMAATAQGLATQNAVASQQQIQNIVNANFQNGLTLASNQLQAGMQLSTAITTQAVKRLLDASIENSVADTKLLGADIQDKLANVEAALSGAQVFEKTAITSPPQTGTGGAFGSDAGSALLQQMANIQALLQSLVEKLEKDDQVVISKWEPWNVNANLLRIPYRVHPNNSLTK